MDILFSKMPFRISKKFISRSEFIFRHLAIAMIIFTLVLVFFPLLLVFRLLTWLIVVLVIKWKNRGTTFYGKLLAYGDACVDESFCDDVPIPPRLSVVATMTMTNENNCQSLTLPQLRTIFIKNVLKATIPGHRNKVKIRYPELQQYVSTLLGFRIWKQDPNFNINYHIVERIMPSEGSMDLSKIHQELLNKPYHKHKSPWEIILIRPSQNERPPVLACRMHHILGDAESILKLYVECLGQKQLKTPERANDVDTSSKFYSWQRAVKFYCLFPFHHLRNLLHAMILFLKCWSHPWKIVNYRSQKFSTSLLTWSESLEWQDIELVAKTNDVTPSAVIMGLCVGAIRKCQEDVLGKRDVVAGYPFQKPRHPSFFANHRYLGILRLPTSVACPLKRLQECHQSFESAKTSYIGKNLDIIGRLAVTVIPYPFTNYFTVNRFIPVALSHVVGDEEGFSILNANGGLHVCSDFRMSVGTYKGVAGVMMCVSSYKNTVRIAMVANDTVMESRQVEMLASNVLVEWTELKKLNLSKSGLSNV